MTTSLLYHAYGISGVQHKSTQYTEDQVIIAAEMTHNSINLAKLQALSRYF